MSKRQYIITCDYCELFNNGGVCSQINKEVAKDTPVCGQFVPCQFFWCERDGNRIHVGICKRRKFEKRHGCGKCKQGKIVSEMEGFKPRPKGIEEILEYIEKQTKAFTSSITEFIAQLKETENEPVSRTKKRGRRRKADVGTDLVRDPLDQEKQQLPPNPDAPKRKRGRPRKIRESENTV